MRAKRKIRDAGIPYRVPYEADLPERLRGVLAVLYLIFNQGHLGDPATAAEAVRLARLLAALMPDEPEATGLLALMLLTESRRAARTDADGTLVRLDDQDRSRWDRALVEEGQELVRRCLRRGCPGPYQIQAAINAVHSDAARAEDTDWAQIVALYDQLRVLDPGPVVALHRAVAVAERDGAAAGLPLVDQLAADLDGCHVLHAARAELLRRLGRTDEARAAYDAALALTDDGPERTDLRRARATL